ncbi:hypothetical protein [uncultured Clostridium sp.]|uniref:hypothetical protein n=1 Tax=uncultured Clostridium sp. TaxID=59620 RepID=UPI0025FA9E6C|nr:hypothetical protein [uncultured Clostridium sp.]
MLTYKKIIEVNGFDKYNIKNARQNSYAWSMVEFEDYIYVGTSRNMFSSMANSFSNIGIPPSLKTGTDNNAEIWRYKKDGTCSSWERVFKTAPADKSYGFRIMTVHKSKNKKAIYAATMGEKVSMFKSIDGVHWLKLCTPDLSGTSSRAMVSFNGQLYISTLKNGLGGNAPSLYSSPDPQYEPFKPVISSDDKYNALFNKNKNPHNGIDDMCVFNDRLYLGVNSDNGCEIWRSDNQKPGMNDWTLISDKGFGDKTNKNIMSFGIFKNHLYAAVSKALPLSLYAPLGFDLIRIDKNDNWQIVVGSDPLAATLPSTGKRNKSISGFKSGFNNFFNVYGWQIKEFKDTLVITTFNDSTNIETIYEGFLYNKENYIKKIGPDNYRKITESYSKILFLMKQYNYTKGFQIYQSHDGTNFSPSILNGLNNPNNYGGRTLIVSSENNMFLGTANPYEGCEIWKVSNENFSCCSNHTINSYFKNLSNLNKDLICIYPILMEGIQSLFSSFYNN